MADKYCDVSATYNGDGTTKDQASADGGVGAWSSFKAVLGNIPGYGSVDNGDHVYVRTADSVGNLGESVGNESMDDTGAYGNSVFYHMDQGDVWLEFGAFTFDITAEAPSFGGGIIVYAPNDSLVFKTSVNDYGICLKLGGAGCYIKGLVLDVTNGYRGGGYIQGDVTIEDYKFIYGNQSLYSGGYILRINYHYKLKLINPTFDFRDTTSDNTVPIFTLSSYVAALEVIGGQILTTGVKENLYLVNFGAEAFDAVFDGFDASSINFTEYHGQRIDSSEATHVLRYMGHNFDFAIVDNRGVVQYEQSGFYPTRLATLPDGSNTTWSYKISLTTNRTIGKPVQTPPLKKVYTLADAVVTAKMAVLANDDYGQLTTTDTELHILYTDAGGDFQHEVTSFGQNLTQPTESGWSALSYGALGYTPHEISLTTSNSVKQGTVIRAFLSFTMAGLVSKFFFIDPELEIS